MFLKVNKIILLKICVAVQIALSCAYINSIKNIHYQFSLMFITTKAQCKQYIKGMSFQFEKKTKKIMLLVKTIHFTNKLRSHLVAIVQMAPFTVNLT